MLDQDFVLCAWFANSKYCRCGSFSFPYPLSCGFRLASSERSACASCFRWAWEPVSSAVHACRLLSPSVLQTSLVSDPQTRRCSIGQMMEKFKRRFIRPFTISTDMLSPGDEVPLGILSAWEPCGGILCANIPIIYRAFTKTRENPAKRSLDLSNHNMPHEGSKWIPLRESRSFGGFGAQTLH